jgi:tripartite-type tricarboxylate transporter receptor subunit TctC
MMHKNVAALCLAAWASLAVQAASAQVYPSKPVRAIVSSTAGGPLDVFTRLITEKMSERLKQPFVVENRVGAGGNIAAQAVAKSAPDGATVLFAVDTTLTVNPFMFAQVPFDPDRDFIPVSLLATFGQMLTLGPSVPVNTIGDLAALSKRRPLNYASSGNGMPAHLSFAYLQAVAGIQANHIPYKGNPPAVIALMSGEVDAGMFVSTSILPNARSGKLRMLAYSDSKRSLVAPEVATVAELGYPGFEAIFGYVLLVPAGTPNTIVHTLHQEAIRAVMAPDVRERLKGFDVAVVGAAPAESAAWLRAGRAKWGPLIRQLNVKAE